MIERILAASEKEWILKSVDYIEESILRFQRTNHGTFVLGLHGPNGRRGRTRMTELVCALAARTNIKWKRVCIFLVDERYGSQNVQDSNAFLVRDAFASTFSKLGTAGVPEDLLLVPNTELSPVKACAKEYKERLLALLERESGPHLVTLDLGADMSIASVFPEWYQTMPQRWAAASAKEMGVVSTTTTIFEVRQRISVNLRVIRKSERIMLFLQQGAEDAWKKVKQAFDEERFGERAAKKAKVVEPTGVMMTSEGVLMVQANKGMRTARPPPESPLNYVLKYSNISVVQLKQDHENHHSLVIFGAAGDLAKKKTFPAIFQLSLGRMLPVNSSVFGVDDTAFHKDLGSKEDFWERRLRPYLEKEKGCDSEDLQLFKDLVEFAPVSLSDASTLRALDQQIREAAKGRSKDHRIFYLALPSFLFAKAVEMIRLHCWSETGSCRVIVEKPFGKNGSEARELSDRLQTHLKESETYRIDHYLAKTLVLNLLTLRFANRELGCLFHQHHIANVRITFKENIGVAGRAGYFDSYGIIRDIMQNHLMQVLALVAMEAPASLAAEDVRDEKVKVLKQIPPIEPQSCVIGQYDGYQDDPEIKKVNERKGYASRCPTFAVAVMYLDNERWSGVPFILKAGKALETSHCIVRLQFKKAPPNSLFGDQPQNELVIRIQPNEAIYYKVLAKLPGLSTSAKDVKQTVLDLDLKKRFELRRTPEAYEKLIHDVIQGESHNFVRRDELDEAWRIFDPLLRCLEAEEKRVPERYAFGSRGPLKADTLLDRLGYRRYTATGVPGFAEDDFD